MKERTREELLKLIEEQYKDPPFSIKRYQWEENGESYSAWDISTPGMTLHTGDGGIIEFVRVLQETFQEELKNFKYDPNTDIPSNLL